MQIAGERSPPGVTPLVTIDASAMVAVLVDGGPAGRWVLEQCRGARLIAPALLQYEVANVLRRHLRVGLLSPERALVAHRAVVELRVDYWPYTRLAERVWQLSGQLTSYDASYCALAELTNSPLLTLDEKLSRTTGPTCEFRVFAS
jgi:predicted nucleic acid-binding protein